MQGHKLKIFIISHTLLFVGIILWLSPLHGLLKELDIYVFRFFNQSLSLAYWQNMWGLLNHRSEGSINLVCAACISTWAIIQTPNNRRYTLIVQTIYFWIFFQIGFMLQEAIAVNWLHIERLSPTLQLNEGTRLAEILHNPRIKDMSYHSFPGGHAFAMIYWGVFTLYLSPRKIGILAALLAIFLCLPRLFSGAHWLSDVIFSSGVALVWFSWTLLFPLYDFLIKLTQDDENFLRVKKIPKL